MNEKIFISYRRLDSPGTAGRLRDRLETTFGADLLFFDVDSIEPGLDFAEEIRAAVGGCNVLLAVIGPNWLDSRHEDGTRRLDDPNDPVRIEIAAALERKIRVIPVLLDGTLIPKKPLLPDDIQPLSQRNGVNIRNDSFRRDVEPLETVLKKLTTSVARSIAPIAEEQVQKSATAGVIEKRVRDDPPLDLTSTPSLRKIHPTFGVQLNFAENDRSFSEGLCVRVKELLKTFQITEVLFYNSRGLKIAPNADVLLVIMSSTFLDEYHTRGSRILQAWGRITKGRSARDDVIVVELGNSIERDVPIELKPYYSTRHLGGSSSISNANLDVSLALDLHARAIRKRRASTSVES